MYLRSYERLLTPSHQTMNTKTALRQRLLVQRATLTALEVYHKSVAITVHVCAMPAFRASQTVMVYMALAQEVQTGHIIEEARRQHKRIAVPVIQGPTLVAVELPPDEAALRRGPYGILEPVCTTAIVRPADIACVLVPGVAFDQRGGRLGFGYGYYDRFLAQLPPTACYCGLAFGIQLLPCVPRRPHDICMHWIVTEQGAIPCQSRSTCQTA
jgi:5-formyltetrahydrofolate cyclo-ligase